MNSRSRCERFEPSNLYTVELKKEKKKSCSITFFFHFFSFITQFMAYHFCMDIFVRVTSKRKSKWKMATCRKTNEKWHSAYVSHLWKYEFVFENHPHAYTMRGYLILDIWSLDARYPLIQYSIHSHSLNHIQYNWSTLLIRA